MIRTYIDDGIHGINRILTVYFNESVWAHAGCERLDDSMGPLRQRPRSGMDPRVKPEDDEIEGLRPSSWSGEAVRSLPPRADEQFVPVRIGFFDQVDLPLA